MKIQLNSIIQIRAKRMSQFKFLIGTLADGRCNNSPTPTLHRPGHKRKNIEAVSPKTTREERRVSGGEDMASNDHSPGMMSVELRITADCFGPTSPNRVRWATVGDFSLIPSGLSDVCFDPPKKVPPLFSRVSYNRCLFCVR